MFRTPLELLIWLMIEEVRKGVLDVATDLARLDQRLEDLAALIPFPLRDVRWRADDPAAVPANLHAVISTVRENYLQEAVEALKWAARQTPESLWLQFTHEEEP